ncbi:extracellular catalytic domain type 1 short-chain-length polyhydroxyalkanoate depolymerase [Parasulfitobacter algicola]|uniref:PHB depolymerase family esterase n=1 Tax=Parasulfitobacter algicola TaxID=2614809 RepID=A0ABX2INW1_9RHOB|nr:PHB depolymerase family esterase [Sulfitobacter algicola]NSX54240.1 PHB depolymerase family esterase [Sulfitobacter algicola]
MTCFEARQAVSAYGHIDYKLYIPKRPSKRPALLIMLHGCTQDPDDFSVGTGMNALADRYGFLIAYPHQKRSNNINRCWNWYLPDHQGQIGEPARIVQIVDDLIAEHGVHPRKIYAAGLSAGGAMAAILGRAYPERFAAIGVHSGVPTEAATNVAGAMIAMRHGGRGFVGPGSTRTIIFQGQKDRVVCPKNADRLAAAEPEFAQGGLRRKQITRNTRVCNRIKLRRQKPQAHVEYWLIDGLGHAWSGGHAPGSYTDSKGPDASVEMARFFLSRNWLAHYILRLLRLLRLK